MISQLWIAIHLTIVSKRQKLFEITDYTVTITRDVKHFPPKESPPLNYNLCLNYKIICCFIFISKLMDKGISNIKKNLYIVLIVLLKKQLK